MSNETSFVCLLLVVRWDLYILVFNLSKIIWPDLFCRTDSAFSPLTEFQKVLKLPVCWDTDQISWCIEWFTHCQQIYPNQCDKDNISFTWTEANTVGSLDITRHWCVLLSVCVCLLVLPVEPAIYIDAKLLVLSAYAKSHSYRPSEEPRPSPFCDWSPIPMMSCFDCLRQAYLALPHPEGRSFLGNRGVSICEESEAWNVKCVFFKEKC